MVLRNLLPNRVYYFLSKHYEHLLQLYLFFILASSSLLVYATFYGL